MHKYLEVIIFLLVLTSLGTENYFSINVTFVIFNPTPISFEKVRSRYMLLCCNLRRSVLHVDFDETSHCTVYFKTIEMEFSFLISTKYFSVEICNHIQISLNKCDNNTFNFSQNEKVPFYIVIKQH